MAFWQYGFDHYFKGYTLTGNKITLYKRKPRKNKNIYVPFDKQFSKEKADKLAAVLNKEGVSLSSSDNDVYEEELKEILKHLIERALQKKDLSV